MNKSNHLPRNLYITLKWADTIPVGWNAVEDIEARNLQYANVYHHEYNHLRNAK